MIKYKLSKQVKLVIGIIFISVFVLVYIICSTTKNKEPIANNRFIKTKLHNTDINNKIIFRNLTLANMENESIQQYLDSNFIDYECIYTHNGVLIFYVNRNNIDIALVESTGYLRVLENTTSNNEIDIKVYSNEELIDKLFNTEFSNIDVFSYTNLLKSTNSYITEDTYKQDIIKALQGDTTLISAYFENDTVTEDISSYLKEKINDSMKYRVLSGKSSGNEKNIDRICILGLNTSDDSNIELKVILKLNKHQKVYGIDIY